MSKSEVQTKSGVGCLSICFLLTLVFVVLKLAEVITWSWWAVFTPMFVWVGLMALILLVVFFILTIVLIAACVLSVSDGKLK